jgi:iron transport multicopper oxidase
MHRFEYDEEYIVPLAGIKYYNLDWYYTEHQELMEHYLSPNNPDGVEPVPDAPLIDNSWTDAIYRFHPGKTYRLRFVSMSALGMFNVWIDDHRMTIIEVDGVFVQPYKVDSLPIAAGQRYSVLVTAKRSAEHNYKLHANFDPKMFATKKPNKMAAFATIMYDESAEQREWVSHGDPDNSKFDDSKLIPLESLHSQRADISIDMNADFSNDEHGINRGHFNDISFHNPEEPTLLTVSRSHEPMSLGQYEPQKTNAHILGYNQMVQVVIRNFDSGEHPFHLHGHVFQIIKKGKGKFEGDWDSLNDIENPMRRDTICVEPNGYVILRFRADNPGIQLLQ